MNIKIGMRNIKTAISVFLCVIIAKFLKLDYPFYAAIAAIISLQNTTINTFKTGKTRMLGTIIGAIIGMAFALIQPGNAVLCGIGIVLLIFLCDLFNWNSSITIAGIVFMAIMVNLNGKSPILYSFNRIIDTFIGISIALLVNYLVFPYDNTKDIFKSFESLSNKFTLIIQELICSGKKADISDIGNVISKLNFQIDNNINEVRLNKSKDYNIISIKKQLEIYNNIYEHLKIIDKLGEHRWLSNENIEMLSKFNFRIQFKNVYSQDELNIVYNYHIGRIIEELSHKIL